MLIAMEGTGKNRLEPGQESMAGCPVVITSFFATKSLAKTGRYAGHCREGETNCWISIFQGVSF